MKRKSILLLLIMTLIMPSIVFGADVSQNEVEGNKEHWGNTVLTAWQEQGLVNGFPDGSLRPDEQVTRAQFVTLLNNLFQFSTSSTTQAATISFKDVASNDWFYQDVVAVATAGIIQGYPDGSFKPQATVSRQDAAKMLATAFKLKQAESSANKLSQFADETSVSSYARLALEQLIAVGAIQGYNDGTIRPLKALTRAEAITLLDRLSGTIIHQAGTYRDLTIDGSLVIRTGGVDLQNVTVKGEIYVTPGVGEADLHLRNVTSNGILHINGGGVNSIYIEGSSFNGIIINKLGGKVRVVISKATTVNELIVENDAIIELDENSLIELLNLLQGAAGSELKGNGTIKKLLNAAGIELPDKYKASNETEVKEEENNGGGGIVRPTTPPATSQWQLVWSDEFDRSGTNLDINGVDLDKWGYQLGTGSQYGLDGWGNNEQQYYRSENIVVEDGVLKITAKPEQHEGKPYTSGRLFTEPTFSKTYGKFEARMKLPAGNGLWPAFWMMPTGSEYGTWAASGEIDIMEARGRLLDEVGGAIHYGKTWPNNKFAAKNYDFPEDEDITGYHVYGLEWEPGELRWYVDGQLFQTINNWDSWGENEPAKYAFPAPFDKPFYMILNLAVGGNYDGGIMPDESMESAEMLVDYVRVYELVGRPYREVEEPSVEVEPIDEPYKQAVEGSYIYDANYEQPITTITTGEQQLNQDYWNLVYLDTFGGSGDIAVEELEDDRYAKVSISQPGSQPHSIQLIQHVTVGKGRWYKLSFDAKAEANRNIAVKIGGGESRGWSVYSDSYDIALTNAVQSYERLFHMTADTDKLARLEFNMGLNSSAVWLGNVRLEEVDAPDPYNEAADKQPLANGNHIYNGSFDLGYIHRLTYWQLEAAQENAAQLSVDPTTRELQATIINDSEQASDIALVQQGTQFIGGNEYQLTFKARAEQGRTIQAALLHADGSIYGTAQQVQLTDEMNEYTVSFTLDGEETSYGTFALMLGGDAAVITIDDIVLLRTTNNNIGQLSLEQQFPLKNGDFSNGITNWTAHVQGKYDGWDQITDATVEDESLVYNIEGAGGERWHVMLMQNQLQLSKNQTYIVSVDAKSTVDREMEIVLETANYNSYLLERVSLNDEWQTYSYELPMTEDAALDFKLMLGALQDASPLGRHTVMIDNVRIEVKDARNGALLATNGYFDDGMDGWLTHVQGVYEGNSEAEFTADGALTASIANWGANPWDIVLFQDAVNVKKGETYTVSFVAKADVARAIDVVVENSAYVRSLNEPVQLTEDVALYQYEFTMERDEPVQLKFLLGKPSGSGESSEHHIYIDNVRFELKGARDVMGEVARTAHDLE